MSKIDNPKYRDSSHKVPISLCPASIRIAIARVLKIGGEKPGRWNWNWRYEPISFTQYMDAHDRHLASFQDGEDYDTDMTKINYENHGFVFSSVDETPEQYRISHLDAAASSLAIIIDARESNTLIDDRQKVNNGAAAKMLLRYQNKKEGKK